MFNKLQWFSKIEHLISITRFVNLQLSKFDSKYSSPSSSGRIFKVNGMQLPRKNRAAYGTNSEEIVHVTFTEFVPHSTLISAKTTPDSVGFRFSQEHSQTGSTDTWVGNSCSKNSRDYRTEDKTNWHDGATLPRQEPTPFVDFLPIRTKSSACVREQLWLVSVYDRPHDQGGLYKTFLPVSFLLQGVY